MHADPAAVLAYLKEMASNEREAARNAALAAEQDAERAVLDAEQAVQAAQAAEASLLAELDAEDAAKKGGKKKKKKKKKKVSGKKGKGEEPDDWRTDFQRYVQSDMMRGVDERKRQRNLEEAARIMAAHEQKIAARSLPPSLDPAPPAAPDALAETVEDIEAQIAALGLPPDYSPAPPPAAAPDAFLESLLAASPPALAPPPAGGQSLLEQADELYRGFYGGEKPEGTKIKTMVEQLEEELLGGAGEGTMLERVKTLREVIGL
ncbi:hypothetical protein TeGR_g10748 [Tetraparma gracilis]|nr:hypothetical protein TeGR_g10748 [Tetraparma gracilis]